MFLLLQQENNVSRLHSGRLVCLPRERDPLAVLHALVHVDFEDLDFFNHLLPLALFTAVLLVNDLSWEESRQTSSEITPLPS